MQTQALSTPPSQEHARTGLRFLWLGADKFPPARVDVAVLFGREMLARKHRIDWILQAEADCDRPRLTRWMDCDVWVGPTDSGTTRLRRIRKHWLGMLHDLKLFARMRANRYDVVQVKDKFLIAPLAALNARRCGCRFTYWLSYPFPEASLHRACDGTARYPVLYLIRGWVLKFMLYRIILPLADSVFVQSEQMKADLMDQGVPREKLIPVPMGIVLENLPDVERREPVPGGPRCIVYLGTLLKVRRMDFLVRAFALVADRLPDVRLELVGGGDDPSDERILLDEAQRLGVADRLTITGFLPQSEAWRRVAEADLCVSPFYPTPILNSTSPTKLIEYMAIGRPVVANDHPEQRLVIAESGGGLCVPYEETAFAQAMIELLEAPQLAEQMGRKGREYVLRKRSYDRIASMIEERYLAVVNGALLP